MIKEGSYVRIRGSKDEGIVLSIKSDRVLGFGKSVRMSIAKVQIKGGWATDYSTHELIEIDKPT